MSPRTTNEALRAAVREAAHPRRDDAGMCLRSTRILLGVPSGATSARLAWDATPRTQRHPLPAPPGRPIFWAVGQHGHVGLSAGHDLVWSVDIRRRGRLDPVWTDLIEAKWGAKVLGWTDTLNGVRLL